MELLDIVNENNQMIGKTEERNLAHEKGLWHRHVSCWIMNEKGEVLLQKRAKTKDRNPNKWSKTGGHVDVGESVEKALIREVKEEIGIDLTENDIELIEIFKSNDINNKYFAYDYFIKVNYQIEDYIIQKEEVSEVGYFTIEEMEKLKRENNTDYTFSNWDNDDFYEKMQFLKEKRAEISA